MWENQSQLHTRTNFNVFRILFALLGQSVRWNENTSEFYVSHVLDKDRKSLLPIPKHKLKNT